MKLPARARIIATIALFVVLSPASNAAINIFNVTGANGTQDYIINGANDPDFTLVRGFIYTFNINTPGHPFWIKQTLGTLSNGRYDNGVSGVNGTSSGTLVFTVPANAPDLLYYQCGAHFNMNGELRIVDPPDIEIVDGNVDTEVTIVSTGYDADILDVNVQIASNLVDIVWEDASNQMNTHASGTNTTTFTLPVYDPVFIQVQQGFF